MSLLVFCPPRSFPSHVSFGRFAVYAGYCLSIYILWVLTTRYALLRPQTVPMSDA